MLYYTIRSGSPFCNAYLKNLYANILFIPCWICILSYDLSSSFYTSCISHCNFCVILNIILIHVMPLTFLKFDSSYICHIIGNVKIKCVRNIQKTIINPLKIRFFFFNSDNLKFSSL